MIKNPNPNVGQEFLDLHMSRLLKVFLCFRSAAYEPALLFNMIILHYLRDKQHPVWKMFNNNLAAFNEEPGELSFSLLQRFTRKDTLRADFEHLDEKYKLISLYYQLTKDFSSEVQSNVGFTAYFNPIEIKDDSDEVTRLGEHFTNVLKAMKDGSWAYYQTLRKPKKRQGWAKDFFGKRDTERQNLQLPEVNYPVYFLEDSSSVFDEVAKKAFEGHFRAYRIGTNYAALFKNQVEEEKNEAESKALRQLQVRDDDEYDEWRYDEEDGLAMDQFDDGEIIDEGGDGALYESKYEENQNDSLATNSQSSGKSEAKDEIDEPADEPRTPSPSYYRSIEDDQDDNDQMVAADSFSMLLGFDRSTENEINYEESDEPKVEAAMTKVRKPKVKKEKVKKAPFEKKKRKKVDKKEVVNKDKQAKKVKMDEDEEESEDKIDVPDNEVDSGEQTDLLEDAGGWIADESTASSSAVGIRLPDRGSRPRRCDVRPNYATLHFVTNDNYSKHAGAVIKKVQKDKK